ncbi:GNAT family N-acetyltransferase [Flavobacteriaceae bacterium]|jgi:putative acetyltransferase|nr:GNAT family N-acetyltransferase [Flavobacteriaceae bacterium]
MIIREILPQDNMSIKAIITNCFKEYNLPIAGSSLEDNDANYMYQGFQQLRAVYYVIEDGDKILGGGGIKHLLGAKNDICELQKMYFHPDIRGQGFGKRLLDLCMNSAKKFNYKFCYLESASQLKTALTLYEKNGFEHLDTPRGYTGHTICGIYMLKKLI